MDCILFELHGYFILSYFGVGCEVWDRERGERQPQDDLSDLCGGLLSCERNR